MSKAEQLFNVMHLLRKRPLPRKAVIAARNAAMTCSADDLSEYYRRRAYKDADFLAKIGIQLQNPEASPTVHQSGTDEIRRPKAKVENSVGAEKASTKRSQGMPSIAKKSGDAVPTDRPRSAKETPTDALRGFLSEK